MLPSQETEIRLLLLQRIRFSDFRPNSSQSWLQTSSWPVTFPLIEMSYCHQSLLSKWMKKKTHHPNSSGANVAYFQQEEIVLWYRLVNRDVIVCMTQSWGKKVLLLNFWSDKDWSPTIIVKKKIFISVEFYHDIFHIFSSLSYLLRHEVIAEKNVIEKTGWLRVLVGKQPRLSSENKDNIIVF